VLTYAAAMGRKGCLFHLCIFCLDKVALVFSEAKEELDQAGYSQRFKWFLEAVDYARADQDYERVGALCI